MDVVGILIGASLGIGVTVVVGWWFYKKAKVNSERIAVQIVDGVVKALIPPDTITRKGELEAKGQIVLDFEGDFLYFYHTKL